MAAGKYQLDLLTVDVSRLDIRSTEGKQNFLERVEQFLAG